MHIGGHAGRCVGALLAALLAALLMIAGCFSARRDYPSGELRCSQASPACPDGYVCATSPKYGDARCFIDGQEPKDGATDGKSDGAADRAPDGRSDGPATDRPIDGDGPGGCLPGQRRCSDTNRPQKCN